MMDPKKLSAILKAGPKAEPEDSESEDTSASADEGLAGDIIDALRSKDAAGLASALRSFVEHCQSYDDEDEE